MAFVMRGVLSHFACGEQHSILLKSQADIILAKDKALRRQFKEARL